MATELATLAWLAKTAARALKEDYWFKTLYLPCPGGAKIGDKLRRFQITHTVFTDEALVDPADIEASRRIATRAGRRLAAYVRKNRVRVFSDLYAPACGAAQVTSRHLGIALRVRESSDRYRFDLIGGAA